jgi:hypothetical protein
MLKTLSAASVVVACVVGCQTKLQNGTARSATAPVSSNTGTNAIESSEVRLASGRDRAPSDHIGSPIAAASAPQVTKDDVIDWTQRGLSDETIIDRIERSGSSFHLNAADVNELRDRGVSSSVLALMRRQVP